MEIKPSEIQMISGNAPHEKFVEEAFRGDVWEKSDLKEDDTKNISYITSRTETEIEDVDMPEGFTGFRSPAIDLKAAMERLHSEFGVKRLVVVGGGHINGSMLDLGLIDEVSMMYGYGIDGREGMAAAFDGRPKNRKPVRLTFKSVEEQDGIVWMRYLVK